MFSKSKDLSESPPPTPASRSLDQIDILADQMAAAWRNGEEPTADEILKAHPELNDESAIRLIFEEVSLRRESGQAVNTVEILARYPKWRDDLEPLLGFDKILNQPTRAHTFEFPEVGGRLGDFQLRLELGRGASGRTFLAEQPSLADRPVVLKLMARDHSEHLSLARLQHTYIVPLYWEQEFPELGLRGLLMPYLGGANLSVVLDEIAKIPLSERLGSDFNDALTRLIDPARQRSMNDGQRFQQFLGMATYGQAACWITLCLADALQYAHDRGLIHMDVKPSNVLIAADGQPMLLDFHLARPPIPAWSAIHDRLGGTPGWTSPEQEAAIEAAIEGKPVEVAVDGRSDVYALGLLLHEMLGGTSDRTSRDRIPKLRSCNPAVSTGLSDIIERSLAHDPADRYPSAAKFADDLRSHLQDLPLKGVSNRNLGELWAKWRRRSPHASAQFLLIAATLTFVTIGSVFVNERIKAIQSWTDESKRLWDKHDYDESFNASAEGLKLTKDTPFYHPNLHQLEKLNARADWAQNAHVLNVIANQIRFAYGAVSDESYKIRELAPKLKKVWENHRRLEHTFDQPDDTIQKLQEQVAIDFQEIAVVWAHLRTEIEPLETALIDAKQILVEAENAFGTSLTLKRELQKLGGRESIEQVLAKTAWEHYELGRLYLDSNHRVEEAAVEFKASLALDPQAFWTNFFDGNCAYQRGRYEEALAAFRVCVTLDPNSATIRVNRALAYEALGKLDEAYQENTKAIELAPKLVEGYFNRGHVEFLRDHAEKAVLDLEHALVLVLVLEFKSDRSIEARIRYILALAHRALKDEDAFRREATSAAELGSEAARSLLQSDRTRRSL